MDTLLSSMSVRQLAEWKAYNRLDPFGLERFDLHAAMLLATIRNALRGEDDDPVTVEDCMPTFGLTKEQRERREAEKRNERVRRKMMDLRERLG